MSSKLFHICAGLAAVVVAVVCTTAFAAKPGSSSPTLYVPEFSASAAAPTSTPYGTPYTVKGCGYNATNGGVTVVVHSPEAIAFAGQVPDSSGCISVTNFSTQGPGHYDVEAWQHVRNKDVKLASTSFDLS